MRVAVSNSLILFSGTQSAERKSTPKSTMQMQSTTRSCSSAPTQAERCKWRKSARTLRRAIWFPKMWWFWTEGRWSTSGWAKKPTRMNEKTGQSELKFLLFGIFACRRKEASYSRRIWETIIAAELRVTINYRIARRYAAGCPGRKKLSIIEDGKEPLAFKG